MAGDVLQCRPGIPDATAVVKGLHVSGRPAEAATAGDTVELGMGGVDEAFAPLGAVLCVQNRCWMSRRGGSVSANASEFDPHRASLTSRFGQVPPRPARAAGDQAAGHAGRVRHAGRPVDQGLPSPAPQMLQGVGVAPCGCAPCVDVMKLTRGRRRCRGRARVPPRCFTRTVPPSRACSASCSRCFTLAQGTRPPSAHPRVCR